MFVEVLVLEFLVFCFHGEDFGFSQLGWLNCVLGIVFKVVDEVRQVLFEDAVVVLELLTQYSQFRLQTVEFFADHPFLDLLLLHEDDLELVDQVIRLLALLVELLQGLFLRVFDHSPHFVFGILDVFQNVVLLFLQLTLGLRDQFEHVVAQTFALFLDDSILFVDFGT